MSKLQEVRDLLARPEQWLKGEYCDNPREPTCFCLNGAVAHVGRFCPTYNLLDADPIIQTLAALIIIHDDPEEGALLGASEEVARWNDQPHRTHDDVLALLDKAISTCPK